MTAQYPPPGPYNYRWRTRRVEAARFGTLCRKVYESIPGGFGLRQGAGPYGRIMVEFEDGVRVLAFRGWLRGRGYRG